LRYCRRTGPSRRRVEAREQCVVDEVDLDRRYAPFVVAHEAAPAPEGLQLRAQPVVVGVHVQQRQRPGGLGIRLDAEAEVRADQVLELVDIGQCLCREDRCRVLAAAQPVDPLDEGAPGRVAEEHPCLVEDQHLVARPVGAHQMQGVGREEAKERLAGALVGGQLRLRACPAAAA